MKYFVLVFVMCLLFSCQIEQKETTTYVDTKSLLEDVITQLATRHKSLQKNLIFDDSSTTQQVSKVNWQKELKPFTDIDLLKNNYKGRFGVDTIKNTAETYTLRYSSHDTRTDLKELLVTLSKYDSSLVAIKARYEDNNTLYKARKELTFYTDSLFTIHGTQQVQLAETVTYQITGIILP